MTTPMLQELNAFYDEHGILPVRFRCPSRTVCSVDSPNFTETKASLVGPLYEERRLPRLLFLSLDSGSAERLSERRTAEFQRRDALVEDVAALPKHNTGSELTKWHSCYSASSSPPSCTPRRRGLGPPATCASSATSPTSTAQSVARTSVVADRLIQRCSTTAADTSPGSWRSSVQMSS